MKIKFRPDLAPNRVQRIGELANEGFYNDVPFHRVIAGFMAQGGDGVTSRGGKVRSLREKLGRSEFSRSSRGWLM